EKQGNPELSVDDFEFTARQQRHALYEVGDFGIVECRPCREETQLLQRCANTILIMRLYIPAKAGTKALCGFGEQKFHFGIALMEERCIIPDEEIGWLDFLFIIGNGMGAYT